jgi:hypothetical protein
MHLLHKALDTDGYLREVIDNLSRRISENPFKQGLILDLNPFWHIAIGLQKGVTGMRPPPRGRAIDLRYSLA